MVPSPAGADAYLQPPPLHRRHHQPALPAEQGPLNQGSRHSWKSRRLLQCCEKWVTLNIRSSTMQCIAGVGSNFYTSKAETALKTFTNSVLRIKNLPCSPAGLAKSRANQCCAGVPKVLPLKERIKKTQSRKNSVRGYISTDEIFQKKVSRNSLNEKGVYGALQRLTHGSVKSGQTASHANLETRSKENSYRTFFFMTYFLIEGGMWL